MGKYPIEWRIRVPSLGIDVTCKAVLPEPATGADYWEGAVDYSGTPDRRGYLEMTGYEAPVSFQ